MRAQAVESLPQFFEPLWQLTPSKLCLDTLWLMPNQSAAAHHLATPFPGPQPWEAPDPLPVMRRELKLLLIEMNVLRVEARTTSRNETGSARQGGIPFGLRQPAHGEPRPLETRSGTPLRVNRASAAMVAILVELC